MAVLLFGQLFGGGGEGGVAAVGDRCITLGLLGIHDIIVTGITIDPFM